MKYLLDTHTLIWFIEEDNQLSNTALKTIQDGRNILLVSIASYWEMSVKLNLGKLKLEKPLRDFYKLAESEGIILYYLMMCFAMKI